MYWWWGPVDTCELLGRARNIHSGRLPLVGLKSYYLLQPKSRQNRIRFIRSIIKLQLELGKIANGLVFKKCSCTMKRIMITVIAFNTATNWYSNLEVQLGSYTLLLLSYWIWETLEINYHISTLYIVKGIAWSNDSFNWIDIFLSVMKLFRWKSSWISHGDE